MSSACSTPSPAYIAGIAAGRLASNAQRGAKRSPITADSSASSAIGTSRIAATDDSIGAGTAIGVEGVTLSVVAGSSEERDQQGGGGDGHVEP